MIDPTRRKELIAAATKLFHDGTKNWRPVLERFPDIPRATAYRIIRAAVEELRGNPPRLGESADEIDVRPKPGAWMHKPTYTPNKVPNTPDPDHLPVPDQIQKLRKLYKDSEALRERSLDKNGKIKNLAAFQKSIELGMKLALADANLVCAMVNSGRTEAVLTSVLDIATQYDPEIGEQLIRDVKHYYKSMYSKEE
jgi:hypothetical protein